MPSRRHDDYYHSDDPYDDRGRYAPRPEESSRRHKSERPRRRLSPGYDVGDDPRRGSRRDPISRDINSSGRRRHGSPPPAYDYEPSRHQSRREPRDSFAPRGAERDRDRDRDRDTYGRDPYRDPPQGRRPRPQSHEYDAEPRPRRSRASPEPRQRTRDAPPFGYDDRSRNDPRSRRSMPSSPVRGKTRGLSPVRGGLADDYYNQHPRQTRSPAGRGGGRSGGGRHASPDRGRPPPATNGRTSPSRRRNSMPATSKKSTKKAGGALGGDWWKNPLIMAGAKTAFSAGAQAAMKNRNDPSPWLGPKGAKVATAALGAALMDGFMSQKKSGGGGGGGGGGGFSKADLMRSGIEAFAGKGDKGSSRRDRSRH